MQKNQAGFILQVVFVLLLVIISSASMFFNRTSGGTATAILEKDTKKAELLAESGINRVMGRFVSPESTVWDINGNGVRDAEEVVPEDLDNVDMPLVVKYAFYRTSDSTDLPIDQTVPGILQRIANGESTATSTSLTKQAISTSVTKMQIKNLFISASARPMLYKQESNNLVESNNTWESETAREKVAVFLELVQNATNNETVDVYISAVAQVGSTKKYMQRFMGAYTDSLGGLLAPLSESSVDAGGV